MENREGTGVIMCSLAMIGPAGSAVPKQSGFVLEGADWTIVQLAKIKMGKILAR